MHNSDLEYIAECFGKAKRTAGGYVCLCPIHNDSSPSLSLAMDGDKLLVHCFAGCEPEEILAAARDAGFSGVIERDENFFAEQTAESKKEYAQAIWNEAGPAKGTLVETYLRSRDITVDIPDSIRYHPRLKHYPSGQSFPAMVAAVTIFPSPEIVAIHRTYLKPDGSGKADVEPNKMMLASVKGGAVMFGPQNEPHLFITEGIENALSIFEVTGLPSWAALSASGIPNVILPSLKDVPNLLVGADHDDAGIRAARAIGDREYFAGRTVMIIMPETPGADFNDLLKE